MPADQPHDERETMKWAQDVSVEDIKSADLVVYPQAEDKQFKQLSETEMADMVALINQSKGKYQADYEQLTGGSVFFYISMKDGTAHSIGNVGNTYLVIDGEYYEANYDWLETGSSKFGEGDTNIPDQYFSVAEAASPSGSCPAGYFPLRASMKRDDILRNTVSFIFRKRRAAGARCRGCIPRWCGRRRRSPPSRC